MHASVCDTLSDLVQNSIEAGASRVELDVYTGADRIEVCVADDGKGMDEATLARAVEPFRSASLSLGPLRWLRFVDCSS